MKKVHCGEQIFDVVSLSILMLFLSGFDDIFVAAILM